MVDFPKHMGIDYTFKILDLYLYTHEKVKKVSCNTKVEDDLLLRKERCSQ